MQALNFKREFEVLRMKYNEIIKDYADTHGSFQQNHVALGRFIKPKSCTGEST